MPNYFILLFCSAFCLLWILFQAAKKHYTVSRSASRTQEGVDRFTQPQKQFVYYRKGFRGHNYPRWFFLVYSKK